MLTDQKIHYQQEICSLKCQLSKLEGETETKLAEREEMRRQLDHYKNLFDQEAANLKSQASTFSINWRLNNVILIR